MLSFEQQRQYLESYRGTNPIPADFDDFWAARMAEADSCPLEFWLEPAEVDNYPSCQFFNLWFVGMHGAKLYARFLRPVRPAQLVQPARSVPLVHSANSVRSARPDDAALPVLLRFHGYPGRTRSWLENCVFAGLGFATITMDNPGQGGRSQDVGGFCGPTVAGHVVTGLAGDPSNLYYVRLHQNIRILCRVVRALEGLDTQRVYVYGDSQGGGVGLATCALNADFIRRAAILYPFLSDFQKTYELGSDQVAYEGLRYYARWFDADGSQASSNFYKLGYIDSLSFAHMVRCSVLFGTGLVDDICPVETQYAVYNNLHCDKKHLLFPEFGHEEIPAFDDAALSWFVEDAFGDKFSAAAEKTVRSTGSHCDDTSRGDAL